MNDTDVTTLLKKADELKALFILGQRVIPFLEEIFIFVNDIKPLLSEINSSIEENLKKMPGASRQLSKVTEATEMATTEIMDILDGFARKADSINLNVRKMAELGADEKNTHLRALAALQTSWQKGDGIDQALHHAAATIENSHNSSLEKINALAGNTGSLIDSLKDDSDAIMMSLQVQDITSQQIAAVNHLLETVQKKLEGILTRFHHSDITDMLGSGQADTDISNISRLHRDIAFDPYAIDAIEFKDTRQDEVDAILRANESGEPLPDMSEKVTHSKAIDKPVPAVSDALGDEAFSQADIDALFGDC